MSAKPTNTPRATDQIMKMIDDYLRTKNRFLLPVEYEATLNFVLNLVLKNYHKKIKSTAKLDQKHNTMHCIAVGINLAI